MTLNKFKVVALNPATYFSSNKCSLTDMTISLSIFAV